MVSELPRFSLSQAKLTLPVERWSRITRSLVRTLDAHLRSADLSQRDSTAFIESYLRDAAVDVLNQPPGLLGRALATTTSESDVRSRVFQMIQRLNVALKPSVLLDLSIAYQRSEELPGVKEILDRHATTFPAVLTTELIPTFIANLRAPFTSDQDDPTTFVQARLKLIRSINGLTRSQSDAAVLSPLSLHKDFLLAVAHFYQTTMAEVASEKGGFNSNDESLSAAWQTAWIEIKVGIVDTFHCLIDHLIRTSTSGSPDSSDSQERLFDVLLSLVDLSTSSKSSPSEWFVDAALLADYEHAYGCIERLRNSPLGENAMIDFVAGGVDGMAKPNPASNPSGGLVILLNDLPGPTALIRKDKGKMKASNVSGVPFLC